jgi:hypothetical protein
VNAEARAFGPRADARHSFEQRMLERLGAAGVGGDDSEAHDSETAARRPCLAHGDGDALRALAAPLLHEHVRVVAAEPERRDAGPARSDGVPGLRSLQQSERRIGERRQRVVGMQRGGRTPAFMAASTFSSAAMPATVIRCPRFDFTDPIGTSRQPANIAALLRISVASPTAVPVAWHSSSETSDGCRPATA